MTPREDLLRIISALPADSDEIRVLLSVAEGLERGLRQYGRLDVATDRRDYLREAVEEHRDALVYLTAEILRLG